MEPKPSQLSRACLTWNENLECATRTEQGGAGSDGWSLIVIHVFSSFRGFCRAKPLYIFRMYILRNLFVPAVDVCPRVAFVPLAMGGFSPSNPTGFPIQGEGHWRVRYWDRGGLPRRKIYTRIRSLFGVRNAWRDGEGVASEFFPGRF